MNVRGIALSATAQQQAVIDHNPNEHGRVLAGPGTGKSWTSVALLERLLEEKPELVVRMLTFTRIATAELTKKLGASRVEGSDSVKPTTVHSFALSLLMANQAASTLPRPLRIADTWERENLIYADLAKRLRSEGFDVKKPAVKALEKEMASGWESLDPDLITLTKLDPALRSAFLGMWAEHRQAFGYALLSELPYRALLLIQDHDIKINIDFMVVDEYQDLNQADITLLLHTAQQGTKLLAVGDDDQSIYSRRMAAPQGIRNFSQDFPESRDYPLTETRRFGNPLIAYANSIIRPARKRAKSLDLTPHPDAPRTSFSYLRFDSGEQEAEGVARLLSARINDEKVSPSGIAVLVRSQVAAWIKVLSPALEKHGVLYASTSWVDEVLEEEEVRRGLAVARLALSQDDSLAWWTLMRNTKNVSREFQSWIYDSLEEGESFATGLQRLYPSFLGAPTRKSADATAALVDDITERIQGLNTEGPDLGEHRWGGWLLDQLSKDQLSSNAVRLLQEVGAQIPLDQHLRGFLSQLEPVGKDLAAESVESVRIMLMTTSKGLTLDSVVVMGVERGLVPLPPPRGKWEEERRILYVAMTRAERLCVLTSAKRRTGQLARAGSPNVGGTRGRCPLFEGLPEFKWTAGKPWVNTYTEAARTHD